MSINELQDLTKQLEETGETVQIQNKECDGILKELSKKRQKLADADIYDNFKAKIEQLHDIDDKL